MSNSLALPSHSLTPSHALAPPAKVGVGHILAALRRRAWLIVLCALLGGVAAYSISKTLPRLYSASGTVVLAAQHFAIPELEGALRGVADSDPMLLVHTEMQALSSAELVGAVSNELHLETMPEFNPALRVPGPFDIAMGWIRSKLSGPGLPEPSYAKQQAVLAEVSRNLTVFNDNRTLVVTVGFTSPDPVLSAEFVNRLLKNYRASRTQQRSQANEEANSTLLSRIAELNQEIAGLEKRAADLRDKSQYIGVRAGSVGQQQVEDLATAAGKAKLDRSQLQATWERASALAKQGASDQLAGVLASDTMSRLRDQETLEARQYAALTSHYGPEYPGVRQARADLQAVHAALTQETNRIVSSLYAQLQVAIQHQADTEQQLTAARAAAVTTTGAQVQLDDLTQEIASRRQLVQTLQVSIQQTMSQPFAQTPDVRVLSAAQPPNGPSSPQPKLAVAFGLAAGGMVGVLLSLATTRLVFASDAPDAAARGLPVFAVLPGSAPRGRRTLPRGLSVQPTREASEALRTLRLRLRASGKVGAPRVVALIPAQSTRNGAQIAFAFARLAAADGERVLLIEGSLQSPALAEMLNINGHDLSEVLEGDLHWRDALAHDTQSPLDLLLANRGAVNAQALLSGMRFHSVLAEAREYYNLIVLSSPSTETPASALTLANCADASILIFDDARDKSRDVGRFVEDLVVTSAGPVAAMLTHAA